MEIDNLPFRQAFQKLYLHKYKEPAWKLLETLCWENRTALKVCFNETKKRIYSVTAYSWLKNRLCLVKCAVYPCLESDGRVDIWNMSDIDLINDGRDDNAELEEMLKLEDILKAYAGFFWNLRTSREISTKNAGTLPKIMAITTVGFNAVLREFLKLLDSVSFSESDDLYILGDLVDRGPEGADSATGNKPMLLRLDDMKEFY